ncbi:MAG: cobalamin-dependent protein, partial [Candidatus Omnitrophica bacterium]|nr:cobalamin-dependent protein [Candidatus Omnitrophota bacterium]
MKILFVMPKVGAWATHGEHKAPNQLYAHWASFVREKGFEDVSVLDCRALEIDMDKMVEEVKERNPDIVVLGDMLHSYGGYAVVYYFLESARLIKKALPRTKIVLGGLWFSATPQQTLKRNPAVDFVVMGEEESFYDLLTAIKNKTPLKDVAGVTARIDSEI